MKRYLFLLIALIALVMVSGCVTNQDSNETKQFSQNNVTFTYPGSWVLVNATSPDAVAAVADPTSIIPESNIPTTFVVVQKSNQSKGSNLQQAYTSNYALFFNNTGYKKISEANITTDNLNASENVYESTLNGIQMQYRAVWLQENGIIYVILCGARKESFESQQANFDLIINSFRVQ